MVTALVGAGRTMMVLNHAGAPGALKPNSNTAYCELPDMACEFGKIRGAWHYAWVAPGAWAKCPGVCAGGDCPSGLTRGGKARRSALKIPVAVPVASVRSSQLLPFCSMVARCSRSRSRRTSSHFGCKPLRAAIGQFLPQHQGEEGAEDVAADGGVGGVEDRPGVEGGLGRAEQLLHPEQVSIAEHRQQRTDTAVGTQHEDTVEPGFVGELAGIDFEGPCGGCDRALSPCRARTRRR